MRSGFLCFQGSLSCHRHCTANAREMSSEHWCPLPTQQFASTSFNRHAISIAGRRPESETIQHGSSLKMPMRTFVDVCVCVFVGVRLSTGSAFDDQLFLNIGNHNPRSILSVPWLLGNGNWRAESSSLHSISRNCAVRLVPGLVFVQARQ